MMGVVLKGRLSRQVLIISNPLAVGRYLFLQLVIVRYYFNRYSCKLLLLLRVAVTVTVTVTETETVPAKQHY